MTTSPPAVAPQNLDAERAVIGSLLIENGGYAQIARTLQASAFYRDAHRKIYRACVAVLEAARALDLLSLAEELRCQGLFEDVGGGAYIGSLVDGVPRSTNIRYYAEIVAEKASLRALAGIGTELATAAYSGGAAATTLLAQTESRLAQLAMDAGITSGAVSVADSLSAWNTSLEHRIENRGKIAGFPTGFPDLDLFTHGWQRRKMVVLAGQTSFGKSVLALDTVRAIAGAGGRSVYYSYEMPARDLTDRLVSSVSGVPLTRILWGNIGKPDWPLLSAAQEQIHGLPIEINDSPSRSIHDVRAECKQIKADRGLAAIVIDHFQLLEGVDGENRVQQLSNISRMLQRLASELDVCVFVLSQLTLSDRDANREPQLDDLRECKSLGHDADIVCMLHPYKPSEARSDLPVVPMKLLIRKQRGGRVGKITLDLERDYVRFIPGTEPAPPVKEPKKPKGVR